MAARVVQIPKGSGRWYVSVNHRGDRKVRKAENQKEAEKIAREINETIRAEKAGVLREDFSLKVAKDRVTFEDFSKTWLEGHVETNLKWNSRRYYADMLKRIPASIGRRSLDEIGREDLRKLTSKLLADGLSRSTVAGLLRTVSAIYNASVEDGVYSGANPALRPARLLRVAEEPGEVDCLDRKEAEHLLSMAKEHFGEHYPVIFAALRTAARQGELIALRWEDIDSHGGFLTIKQTAANGEVSSPKNGKTRKIPMTPQLVALLKEHRRRASEAALAAGKSVSPWVFPSPTGGLMDPSKLRREFAAALTKAGLRAVTFHSLRHTCLTMMAEAGVAMPVLQKIAGHSSITVTARYYLHVQAENHRGAVEVLDSPKIISRSGKSASKPRMRSGKRGENGLSGVMQVAEISG